MENNNDDFWNFEEGDNLLNRFENSLKKNQKVYFDVDEFEEIADKFLILGLPDLALKAVDEGLLQHPGDENLFYLKAQSLLDLNRAEEAVPIILNLKKTDNQNPFLYILEGNAFLILKDHVKAEIIFNKALDLTDDENRYEALSVIAGNYFDSEIYLQAGKYFKEALQFDTKNQDILFNLAICCENSFDYSNAISYYNAYLNIEPYDSLAWFYLGNLYGKSGQMKKSVEAMDFCIAIDEKFDLAYFQKAFTLYLDHQYEKALQAFLKFMDFKNEAFISYYYLAICYKELKDFKNAKKYLLKTIATDRRFNNKSSEPFFFMGQIYEETKKYNLALKYYNDGIVMDPFNQQNWIGMGSVYMKVGLPDLSKNFYRRALSIDPENGETHDTIIKSLILGNQWSYVVKFVKSALSSLGETDDLRVYYAAALVKTGKHKKALKSCPYVFNDTRLFGQMLEICKDESLRKYQRNS